LLENKEKLAYKKWDKLAKASWHAITQAPSYEVRDVLKR